MNGALLGMKFTAYLFEQRQNGMDGLHCFPGLLHLELGLHYCRHNKTLIMGMVQSEEILRNPFTHGRQTAPHVKCYRIRVR